MINYRYIMRVYVYNYIYSKQASMSKLKKISIYKLNHKWNNINPQNIPRATPSNFLIKKNKERTRKFPPWWTIVNLPNPTFSNSGIYIIKNMSPIIAFIFNLNRVFKHHTLLLGVLIIRSTLKINLTMKNVKPPMKA